MCRGSGGARWVKVRANSAPRSLAYGAAKGVVRNTALAPSSAHACVLRLCKRRRGCHAGAAPRRRVAGAALRRCEAAVIAIFALGAAASMPLGLTLPKLTEFRTQR